MSTLETQVAKVALEAEEKAKEAEAAAEDGLQPASDPWDSPWAYAATRQRALELALQYGESLDDTAEDVVATARVFLDFLMGEKK